MPDHVLTAADPRTDDGRIAADIGRAMARNDELIDRTLIRHWLLWGFFWLMLAPTVGVIISTKFNYPEFFGTHAWSTFGRLRPVHVNGVIWGAFSTLFIGLAYYITPRLAGVTEFTTPRITEPAGTSMRPFRSYGTIVVASKRSSTRAVPEFKRDCSRTSNSVPTGISVGLSRSSATGLREVEDDAGAGSPRAWVRSRSIRSRRSEYSARVAPDLRIFTLR